MSSKISKTVFKSKWGFHPVDHPNYLVLKELYRMHWIALKEAHRWQRWRKKTKYRLGDEPRVNSFLIDTSKGSYFRSVNEWGSPVLRWHRFSLKLPTLVADFQLASKPFVDPNSVPSLLAPMDKYRHLYLEMRGVMCAP